MAMDPQDCQSIVMIGAAKLSECCYALPVHSRAPAARGGKHHGDLEDIVAGQSMAFVVKTPRRAVQRLLAKAGDHQESAIRSDNLLSQIGLGPTA